MQPSFGFDDQTYFDHSESNLNYIHNSGGVYLNECGYSGLVPVGNDSGNFSSTSTATGKANCFSTAPETNPDEWQQKPPEQWSTQDVLHWIASVATRNDFSYEKVNAGEFNMNGQELMTLTRDDFIRKDPIFGICLYDCLRGNHNPGMPSAYSEGQEEDPWNGIVPYNEMDMPHSSNYQSGASHTTGESHSENSDSEVEPPPRRVKRPPGRPPGTKAKAKAQKKTGRLWEFIRNLLHDPETCPSVICWEDHDEGVFRFVKSEKVAKIWGKRKNNEKMNYEKLSRAMRYYYKSQVFQPVLGRKLVYKFGPNAKNWRSSNPNFRNKTDDLPSDRPPSDST